MKVLLCVTANLLIAHFYLLVVTNELNEQDYDELMKPHWNLKMISGELCGKNARKLKVNSSTMSIFLLALTSALLIH